jgi:carbon-monoxide dehydrogenase iron sulfur subunit
MRKILVVNSNKCTGCEMCMDICSGRKAGIYSEKTSRIRIQRDEVEAVFIPQVCLQCREHPCVDICPVGAIQYDESLCIFNVDVEICTGCGECEKVCPYHGIFVCTDVAMKCDLCDGEPACVTVCYPKALQFKKLTEKAIQADLENKRE